MKKVVFILAFAFVAAFSYAGYSSIEINNDVVTVVEEDPKADAKEESTEKSETEKTDKKSECTKKESSSCSKSCGSK